MDKCIYQQLLNDNELEHLNLDDFQSVVVNFKAYFGAALSSACEDTFCYLTLLLNHFIPSLFDFHS